MRRLLSLITFIVASCASTIEPEKKQGLQLYSAKMTPSCLKGFNKAPHLRRAPPADYLVSLFGFIKNADDIYFEVNEQTNDIFSHLTRELQVTKHSDMKRRRAAMFELLRVSAAMESSYNWQQGRDKSASNYSLYTQEAGIFQTSPNSHVYCGRRQWSSRTGKTECVAWPRWTYLDEMVAAYGVGRVSGSNNTANAAWNALMKDESKKDVIFRHHAYMLRHNFRHYGPMIDKARVGNNISRECIKEVELLL